MIPTPIIERLLALRLANQEATQILIPVFPPNTSLDFSAGPIEGDYAQIVYGIGFGTNMVPNAFIGEVRIWGTTYISGLFTQRVLHTEFQGFVWVTEAQPSFISVTNVSGVGQVFEIGYTSLRIIDEAHYEAILDELDHLATSKKAEQLAQEANQLLRALATGEPAPQPRIS